MRFTQPISNITEHPDPRSTTVSQGLFGEQVEILDSQSDYCHVRCCRDGYRGYVATENLIDNKESATHYVATRATLLFTAPDIKSPVEVRAPFGSELAVVADVNKTFMQTNDGLYALSDHCVPLGRLLSRDLADFAEQHFLGAPYLWGGRSPDGFDCSGLVQMAAFATGTSLPRDSAQQETHLTEAIIPGNAQRSDLVFWPGHVGILLDSDTMLHATAHTMLSVIEPLNDVVSRAGIASSIKRIERPEA